MSLSSQVMVMRGVLAEIAQALDRPVPGTIFVWAPGVWPLPTDALGYTCITTRNAHLRAVTRTGRTTPLTMAHVLVHECIHLFQPGFTPTMKFRGDMLRVNLDGSVPRGEWGKFLYSTADDQPEFRELCALASERLFGAALPTTYRNQWPQGAPQSLPYLVPIAARLAPHAEEEREDVPDAADESRSLHA